MNPVARAPQDMAQEASIHPAILPMMHHASRGGEMPADFSSDVAGGSGAPDRFAFPVVPRRRHASPPVSANAEMFGSVGIGARCQHSKEPRGNDDLRCPAEPDGTPRAIWPRCDCAQTQEACERLAASIACGFPHGHRAVVALVSPYEGDGKTTLASVLAPELARRISGGLLAVDADFRTGDLTARLTLAVSSASGESPLIYPTDRPGLSVLPMSASWRSGCGDPAWIDILRENWPMVLVDTASLEHRETARLVRGCDVACLVVRLGRTLRRAVAESVRAITAAGGQLLGCIVVG